MSAITLYRETLRLLSSQPVLVAAYIGGAVLLGIPIYFTDHLLGLDTHPDTLPGWYGLYATMLDLLLVLGSALLQTLCFTGLGKEFDRPLWRCFSLREALDRFFMMWLLLNLTSVLLSRAQVRAAQADNQDLVAFLELLILIATLTLPVVGACAMYHGRPVWSHLGDSLLPVLRLPLSALQVMAFHFAAYFLRSLVLFGPLGNDSPLFLTLLMAPFAVLDLMGFAAMWRVCMYYRDHGEHVDSDPYDF